MFLLSINQYVFLLELKVSIKCTKWWRYVRSWLNQSDMRSGFDITPQLLTWSTSNPLTAGAAFLTMYVAPLMWQRSMRCHSKYDDVLLTMSVPVSQPLCEAKSCISCWQMTRIKLRRTAHFIIIIFSLLFYLIHTIHKQPTAQCCYCCSCCCDGGHIDFTRIPNRELHASLRLWLCVLVD